MDLKLGHMQLIIDTAKEYGLLRNQLAYVLATVKHETGNTFLPVREAYWKKDAENWRKKNLRYYPWYGRGFVQLTWDYNYKKASKELGVDFMSNPDLVMDPVYSAKILVIGMAEGWFTGKKLSDYITLQKSDFKEARRIVNGTDKQDLIASYAEDFNDDLKALGYGVDVVDVPVAPEEETVSVTLPKSFITSLIELLTKLLSALRGA